MPAHAARRAGAPDLCGLGCNLRWVETGGGGVVHEPVRRRVVGSDFGGRLAGGRSLRACTCRSAPGPGLYRGRTVQKKLLFPGRHISEQLRLTPFSLAIIALVSLALVLADRRPSALHALAASALVLADLRPSALLARAACALVLADRPPPALLALAAFALVLADRAPSALHALAASALVLADPTSSTLHAHAA